MNTITLNGLNYRILKLDTETKQIQIHDQENNLIYDGYCDNILDELNKQFCPHNMTLHDYRVFTFTTTSEMIEKIELRNKYIKLKHKHKKASKYIAELKKKHINDKETWVALGRTIEKLKENPSYYAQNGE